ncbi:MAG: glycosyltransferase [Thermodesulfovibrionales bacterium]|nr:glycosyltransferase [Thermodesulfovibrionales bacterium]
MKIIHFLIGKAKPESKNGIVKVVYNLGKNQSAAGHNVEVWSITDRLGEEEKENILNKYFPKTRTRFILSKDLRKVFEKLNYKNIIFHFHGHYIPEHVFATRTLLRKGIPYIVSSHGILSPEGLSRNYLIKTVYKYIFELNIVSHAAAIHSLGPQETKDIIEYGVKREKIFIIPNGVDLASIPTKPLTGELSTIVPGAERYKILIFIGRIDPKHKGLDLLLKGFSKAAQKVHDLKLIIVGPDHRGGLQIVMNLIQTLDLHGKVHVFEPMYGERKYGLLADSDIFIQSSRWEGMPIGILEALACSKPCIVSNETNLGDKIREYNAGFIVDLDPIDISEKIIEAFSNNINLSGMGRNGRKMIEREFAWSEISNKFCEIYKRASDAITRLP